MQIMVFDLIIYQIHVNFLPRAHRLGKNKPHSCLCTSASAAAAPGHQWPPHPEQLPVSWLHHPDAQAPPQLALHLQQDAVGAGVGGAVGAAVGGGVVGAGVGPPGSTWTSEQP